MPISPERATQPPAPEPHRKQARPELRPIPETETTRGLIMGTAAGAAEVRDADGKWAEAKASQDRVLADKDTKLFAVFDGVGEYAGGAEAAQAAHDAAREVATLEPEYMRDMPLTAEVLNIKPIELATASEIPAILKRMIERASQHVQDLQNRLGAEKTGATANLLLIHEKPDGERTAFIANVGNSRAYLYRKGTLKRLTEKDDSLAQWLVQQGYTKDTEDWTQPPPKHITTHLQKNVPPEEQRALTLADIQNQLTQYIGASESLEPKIIVEPLQAGDRLLLCTDGVHGALPDEELAALLGNPQKAPDLARTIEETARITAHDMREDNPRADSDDRGVVVIDIEEQASLEKRLEAERKDLKAQLRTTPGAIKEVADYLKALFVRFYAVRNQLEIAQKRVQAMGLPQNEKLALYLQHVLETIKIIEEERALRSKEAHTKPTVS